MMGMLLWSMLSLSPHSDGDATWSMLSLSTHSDGDATLVNAVLNPHSDGDATWSMLSLLLTVMGMLLWSMLS